MDRRAMKREYLKKRARGQDRVRRGDGQEGGEDMKKCCV